MASGPIRVLLVEDNSGDAFLVEKHLRSAGHGDIHVDRVDRLGAALIHVRANLVDLVLLDLSLPDFQGIDTFIEARIQIPEIPIVVLTGVADDALAARAVQAGAQDYLVKGSVDAEILVRAIRHAIERHRTESLREELSHDEGARTARQLATGVAGVVDAPVRDLITDMLALGEVVEALRRYRPEEPPVPEPVPDDEDDWDEPTAIPGRQPTEIAALLDALDARRRHALDAAKRVQAISNELRAFGGIARLEKRAISLNALVRQHVEREGRHGTAEIVLDLETLPEVLVDREAMTRLLATALHFFTDRAGAGQVAVRTRHADPCVTLDIEDDLPAMSPRARDAVFEPFGGDRRSGGGLGLAVCAEIAKAHGALVSFDTTEDGHNRFRLELPVNARP